MSGGLLERPGSDLHVEVLARSDREAALALLAPASRANLLLIDAVRRLGRDPLPGEARSELLGVRQGERLVALGAQQPLLAVSAGAGAAARRALLPELAKTRAGLVKCEVELAGQLWARLRAAGRRPLLDRIETAWALEPATPRGSRPGSAGTARPAERGDLTALVEAARESLREERRPDPFEGDAPAFRRWVASRLSRAVVVEREGGVRFVGYADVQSPEGWLLQGIYTWPAFRRRGLAAVGVEALCARAAQAGASHVQLAVVEGNVAAEKLYASLGFRPFERLRTLLFH